MKIYNRKNFYHGLFQLILGSGLVFLNLRPAPDWRGLLLAGACLFLGGGMLLRALSPALSREDRLEELDERNRLVLLKNRSRAFQLVEYGCLGLTVLFMVAGKLAGHEMLVFVGVGLGFAFSLCLFVDLFTFCYYEGKL